MNGKTPPETEATSESLWTRVLEQAERLASSGATAPAETLRQAVATWREGERAREERRGALMGLHHEINNALVGVRGHAQLALLGPAGRDPGVRERLEVIIRESTRIENAAQRLLELGGGSRR